MRFRFVVLASLPLLLALPAVGHAQFIQTQTLSLDGAQQIMAAAEREAQAQGWAVAISIVDAAGGQILFRRMDGVGQMPPEIALAKARTAAKMGGPTKALADMVTAGNSAFLAMDGLMPLEGGLPILVDGQVVGAVGVSGVMANQDAQVAQAGIDAIVR